MNEREALNLMAKAIEEGWSFDRIDAEVYPKIKEALAQPDMWESILGAVARGWCYEENANKTMDSDLAVAIAKEVQALYTTLPQRTWVGLTDEEIQYCVELKNPEAIAEEVEAKLKEKNT